MLHFSRRTAHLLALYTGIALIIAVFITCLIPNPPNTAGGDKVQHFFAYFALCSWFGVLYPRIKNQIAWAIAFVCMGVGIEFLQGMTGYRSYDTHDMLANATGAVVALILLLPPLSLPQRLGLRKRYTA